MPSKKLRPCPFCGGDDIDIGDVPVVECNNCGASGPHERSKAAAIRAWNARPGNTFNDQIGCLADIRRVVGDPTGKLMQDELVERIAGIAGRETG